MFALETPLSWLRLDVSNATTGWHDLLTDSDFSSWWVSKLAGTDFMLLTAGIRNKEVYCFVGPTDCPVLIRQTDCLIRCMLDRSCNWCSDLFLIVPENLSTAAWFACDLAKETCWLCLLDNSLCHLPFRGPAFAEVLYYSSCTLLPTGDFAITAPISAWWGFSFYCDMHNTVVCAKHTDQVCNNQICEV